MKLNKKALGDVVLWIIRIIVLVAVVAAINFLRIIALNNALQTYDTEFYILNTKMMYSPTGLAYESTATGRTYPGMIDIEKLDEAYINNSMTRNIPSRFTLTDENGVVIKQEYHNKERYNILEPLTFAKQYNLLNKTQYVLIKQGEQTKPGFLTIEMVVSR